MLDRLELLECVLKQQGSLTAVHAQFHSVKSIDACGGGPGCRAVPSAANRADCFEGKEASCVQVAPALSTSANAPGGDDGVPQQEEIERSQQTAIEAKRQHIAMTASYFPSEITKTRFAIFLENSKEYLQRRFPPLDKHAKLARIARSWKFTSTVALVICLNSVTIGLTANHKVGESFAQALSRPSNAMSIDLPAWAALCFAIFFLFECMVHIYVERSSFFFGDQWRWNAFDLALVVSSSVEAVAQVSSLSYVRIFRLFRMVHVLQVIRVLRVFDVLRQMVYAILNSLLSLIWIILVLALMLYVYSVYVTSIVGQHIEGLSKEPDDHFESIKIMDELFGTLSRSMLSVFEGATGGRNYHEIIQPLISIHWIHGVSFLLFWIFIVLGVLNIVTGIFVERATKLAKLDKEMTITDQLDEEQGFVDELKSFFQRADIDRSGTISWEEFSEQLKDTKVRAHFMTMGIDVQSVVSVFEVLDRKGNGSVAIKDFVEGCIRLKGGARSIDVCMLVHDVQRLNHMLVVLMQYTEDELCALYSMMSTGQAPSARHSIGTRLSKLTLKKAQSESFHPLAHAFDYPEAGLQEEVAMRSAWSNSFQFNCPQAEPKEEVLPPVPEEDKMTGKVQTSVL